MTQTWAAESVLPGKAWAIITCTLPFLEANGPRLSQRGSPYAYGYRACQGRPDCIMPCLHLCSPTHSLGRGTANITWVPCSFPSVGSPSSKYRAINVTGCSVLGTVPSF